MSSLNKKSSNKRMTSFKDNQLREYVILFLLSLVEDIEEMDNSDFQEFMVCFLTCILGDIPNIDQH